MSCCSSNRHISFLHCVLHLSCSLHFPGFLGTHHNNSHRSIEIYGSPFTYHIILLANRAIKLSRLGNKRFPSTVVTFSLQMMLILFSIWLRNYSFAISTTSLFIVWAILILTLSLLLFAVIYSFTPWDIILVGSQVVFISVVKAVFSILWLGTPLKLICTCGNIWPFFVHIYNDFKNIFIMAGVLGFWGDRKSVV